MIFQMDFVNLNVSKKFPVERRKGKGWDLLFFSLEKMERESHFYF